MIPSDIKFEGNAAPPQWTDGADQVIEKGTNIRIKIKGIRSEVDKMYAVGTMKEVGNPMFCVLRRFSSLTDRRIILALCRSSLFRVRVYLACTGQEMTEQQTVAASVCITIRQKYRTEEASSLRAELTTSALPAHPLGNNLRNQIGMTWAIFVEHACNRVPY